MEKLSGMWKQKLLSRLRIRGAAQAMLEQLVLAACGAAAAMGTCYDILHPFGLVLVLGAPEPYFGVLALGGAFGALLAEGQPLVLARVCAMAAVCAMRWAKPKGLAGAALLGGGLLVGMTGLLVLSGAAEPVRVAAAMAEAGLAAGLGWQMRRCPPRLDGTGLLLPGVILTVVLCGIPAGPVWPGAAFCIGAGLVMACRGRREQALITAAALSVGLCAASPGQLFVAVAVCGGTLLAVSYAPGSRLRCSALFLLGSLPGMVCAPSVAAAGSFLLAWAGAQAAFLCMPVQWVLAVAPADPAESAGRPAVSAVATRLEAAAESLTQIAETIQAVYGLIPRRGETFEWVAQRTHDSLCCRCERREHCWLQHYGDTMDGLFQLKPVLEQRGRVELEELPGQFSHCMRPSALCAAVGRSWVEYGARRQSRARAETMRQAVTEQYEAIAQALAGLAAQVGRPGCREVGRTGQLAAAFAALGREPLECAVTLDAAGRLQAAVTLRRSRFRQEDVTVLTEETSRICRRQMDLPQICAGGDAVTLIFTEKPRLRPVYGTANCPAGAVCGDAVRQFCAGSRAVMLLCDGMGTGKPAAVDGTVAADLTSGLLRAGFLPETAARLTNVALALKSDEESSATLDLLQVDLYTGAACMYKAGAAPGFVVQGGKARLIDGPGLPVGLLARVEGRNCALHLAPGDWAALVSDGMLDDGTEWVAQQLELCAATGSTPEEAAQLLVKTARMRADRTGRPDDITAAVLKLEPMR